MDAEKPIVTEPATDEPQPPALSDEDCKVCNTLCSPCQSCGDSQEGECYKCWHCYNWDDDELEDNDEHCDALDQDHDWDNEEVRCLHDPHGDGNVADCRACWPELGVVQIVY